jgi:hypothetical protein
MFLHPVVYRERANMREQECGTQELGLADMGECDVNDLQYLGNQDWIDVVTYPPFSAYCRYKIKKSPNAGNSN